MNEITSPVVQHTGSKFRLSDWVVSNFPIHSSYIETHCGAASVLFAKLPSQIEVINDLNGEVVNFFDVLRDQTDALIRAVNLTPYSRAELLRAHQPTDNPLERARRFFVMGWQKFGGVRQGHEGGWRYGKPDAGRSPMKQWLNRCSDLEVFAERLRGVYIECDTALNVIERFDRPQALFYCDPPYVNETCTEEAYENSMTDADHIELSETLHRIQGMGLISGYDCPLYRELYADWKMVTKQAYAIKTIARTECLWISPAAQARQSQKRLF
jgi:DNA adenine methylase